ncbi:GlsB/YeaQ/YmgE family stress response membrane protein [Allokutzneria sp. NRRL B-24872]|uniref:GlsB/YeaQ/YmgE family stress response membrane protein n=1 Tax=Allokutzneria sp. NRRL B-24872 TaxID=1137961 RepID=UPI000A3B9E08|nr:GlsB/YeaQ/YmgE family stress response membrane protein [Allokutzneria sp. NRRL B-24872]
MGFFSWIIFGALAGWAANLIVGGRDRRPLGCLFSIIVGIVGAALGGLVYKLTTGEKWDFEFSFGSFGVAALGAVLLLVIVRLVQSRR